MLEIVLTAWVSAALAVTLLGAYREDIRLAPAKVLASLGFVALAVQQGALSTDFGVAILVGLALSLVGDGLLIGTAPKWFLSGLGVFLAAHVAYIIAFVVAGVDWNAALLGAVFVGLPALWFVGRPILRAAPQPMRGPVAFYVATIATMLVLAIGAAWHGSHAILAVAALLFAASDVFVARDQFIQPRFLNRAIGLPLYYGAQVLLAFSV